MDSHKNGNDGDLIVLTPIFQSSTENVIRVERMNLHRENVPGDVLHVAGGQHSGIIVRKNADPSELKRTEDTDLTLDFNVYLVDAISQLHKQENRLIRFWYAQSVGDFERHLNTQEFFKCLLNDFPKDYITFVKKLLKLFQTGFFSLTKIEVDMKLIDENAVLPSNADLESSSEPEIITVTHVQEVLEHAYPNGMMAEALAAALNCSIEEVFTYLEELSERGLVSQLQNGQWIRAEQAAEFEKTIVKQMPKVSQTDQPSVAIITALYIEKLAIDAILENKRTFVRYKTDGESNVYTMGTIGDHRVVVTKLSAVGHTRAATIAAGSVTTRLLGCFQDVQHVFVVGVGGGVPHFTNKESHVRLGDVVVSTPTANASGEKFAYVYCDSIKRNRETNDIEGYTTKTYIQSDMSIPNIVAQMIHDLKNDCCAEWSDTRKSALNQLDTGTQASEFRFEKPSADSDVLMVPLSGGNLATVAHPDKRTYTKLHLGPVGAGRPARDSDLRSEFAQRFNLKAFDVDFHSVVESIFGNRIDSWAIIRGVADYGDGTRNKEWQPFAALQAATIAKLLINRLPLAYDNGSA